MRLREQRFELSSASIGDVRRWARDRCSECDAGDHIDVDKVEIALGEVLQNIIRYAYEGPGIVDVRVCDLDECVAVTVHDHAPPKPADAWDKKPSGADGGFGLSFIEQCSDAYRFRAIDSGNRCSLYFFVDPGDLSFEAMLWAGELLEARAVDESMKHWCRWSLSDVLNEDDLSKLDIAIDAVEKFESQSIHVPAYHNIEHFRDVLITVCHVVEGGEFELTKNETIAVAIAAILHDFGHPGRKAVYPGEIEKHTIELVQDLFATCESLQSLESSSLCISLIDSTSPQFRGRYTRLQKLFNLCDIGASFIPSYGRKRAQSVASELSYHSEEELWSTFKATWRDFDIAEPSFLGDWRKIVCGLKS